MLSAGGELGIPGARVPWTGAEEAVQCWTQLPEPGTGSPLPSVRWKGARPRVGADAEAGARVATSSAEEP